MSLTQSLRAGDRSSSGGTSDVHGRRRRTTRSSDRTVDLDTHHDSNLRDRRRRRRRRIVDRTTRELHDVTLAGASPACPSVGPGELSGYLPLDALRRHRRSRSATRRSSTSTCRPFEFNGQTYDRDRRRLQRLPRSPAAARRRTTTAATCPTGPTRPGRTTCWRRSGPTSTAPGRPGIFADVLTDGVNTWIVDRVPGQRVRHHRACGPSRSGSASTATEDITFAYDPATCRPTPTARTSWSAPRTTSARATW